MSNDNPLESLSNEGSDPINLNKQSENTAPSENSHAFNPQQSSPPAYQGNGYGYQTQPTQYAPGYAPYPMTMQKSMILAYVLWFLVPWSGAHKFYFGKIKTGIAWIILGTIIPTIGSIVLGALATTVPSTHTQMNSPTANYDIELAIFGVFFVLFLAYCIGLFIWWIVDACLIPSHIQKANYELQTTLMGLPNVSYENQDPNQFSQKQ